MGRRKIEIAHIKDDRNRTVTFIKRKAGLFKKAHELSVLCQVDIAVIILGSNNTFYEYSSVDISNLITVHQNNADLPHNIIEPSDYGEYVKKPRVVLNERKRRRRRTTALQPNTDSGSNSVSSQNSSGIQSNMNRGALRASNDVGQVSTNTTLAHIQGKISRSGSNISDHTRNSVNYPMPQDRLHSGRSFYANNYKDTNRQQFQVNEVTYADHMNKRMRLDTQSLPPGSHQFNYGGFYSLPYENLPKPPMPSNLMNNMLPIQSQFVQIIPANSAGSSFACTNDNVTYETRQNIHPPVTVLNASDGPAPVHTMVHHLNQLNRNREDVSEKPSLKLNISKITNDGCKKSPVVYSAMASPKIDVQPNSEYPLGGGTLSPFSHSKIMGFSKDDMDGPSRSASALVKNDTYFLKPPIGRPPKFPKSPSSSIVIFPSSVASPGSRSVNSTGSPD
ncbi:smp1p [Saccharomyces arboricola H-6]|uniref:Smp1p n=1 Tax=Saccharomyces arboricola (strain H-6 / AS 2.3317 / CBS 10644) TaxID=1160507 RepID=J8Q7Y9_SACAR|nr:smp1p [Saccharomyces arboricola H-6]